MRQVDVRIGGRYRAMVSGRLVSVRVLEKSHNGGIRRKYRAINEYTSREIYVSAARLRGEIVTKPCGCSSGCSCATGFDNNSQ